LEVVAEQEYIQEVQMGLLQTAKTAELIPVAVVVVVYTDLQT
jgi:hypothetical protein